MNYSTQKSISVLITVFSNFLNRLIVLSYVDRTLYVTCYAVTATDLSLNSLLSLCKNLTRTRFCEDCRQEDNEIQTKCYDRTNILFFNSTRVY